MNLMPHAHTHAHPYADARTCTCPYTPWTLWLLSCRFLKRRGAFGAGGRGRRWLLPLSSSHSLRECECASVCLSLSLSLSSVCVPRAVFSSCFHFHYSVSRAYPKQPLFFLYPFLFLSCPVPRRSSLFFFSLLLRRRLLRLFLLFFFLLLGSLWVLRGLAVVRTPPLEPG